MIWASYSLAALAVILAWPAPLALSKARWPVRSPFTAMILWQAIALAGGLSMIGAMLVWGLAPLGDNLLAGIAGLAEILFDNRSADALGIWHVFALSAALLLSMHLVFTLLLTYFRTRRHRRRHRDLLHMLSSPVPDNPATLLINHAAPVAYCLPGGARSVTVLSDSLVELLRPDELHAVLLHEQTHLAQRHHLLQWAFAAWRSALPWLPTSQLAQRAVTELIEMLADDEALKQVDPPTLIQAIAIVASGQPGQHSGGDGAAEQARPGGDSAAERARPGGDGTAERARLGGDSAAERARLGGIRSKPASASEAVPPSSPGSRSIPAVEFNAGYNAEAGPDAEARPGAAARRIGRLIAPQPALPGAQRSAVVGAAGLLLAVPTALLLAPQLWPY